MGRRAPEIDYEAEGLLAGCEGKAREERIALLDELFANGASLEQVRNAIAEDRLPMLAVERMLGGEPRYTAEEVAERSGAPVDFLLDIRGAMGLARPDPSERVLSDHDLEAATILARFLSAGLHRERLLETTRIFGRGIAQGAESVRGMFAEVFLSAGADEHELAKRNAQAADEFLPQAGPLLEFMLRAHLTEQVRHDQFTMSELRSESRLPGTRFVTVCFADLVGFTRLGERLSADEVGRVALDLETIANELVEPPVRLIKAIGDAVMLVALDAGPIVDTALELVERTTERADTDSPPLRAGLACGTALNRSGDWYGTPVNLASRVTAVAPAGSVLCTGDVREAVGDRSRWTAWGAQRFKGIEGEVELFRAER
jgi:adenylate cyclase